MSPRQARGRARPLPRARGARGNRNEGDGENHQESVIGGGANAPRGDVGGVGGALPAVLGGAEFIQRVFTTIEQVVRNTVQAIQVPARADDTRATMAMKAFLQLCPPTFRGKLDPLMLQGDALQWWKTMDESVAKKWEPFKKAFLDQYFTYTENEGTIALSEGHFPNKPKNSTSQQQYPARSLPVNSAASFGQTSRGGDSLPEVNSLPQVYGSRSSNKPIIRYRSPQGTMQRLRQEN
ncbi:hypothetical protein Acr_10g0010720 [Actinidia rufa]|uniref:Retrotransposon gag domain-containing protein n=1 Tax=Actinidia rufa TaxID=165716 RepID=A0A7J0FCQ8_9ERIC|nr:hypothetical protein Acr_10g0010720 [Actinidia rufa]